MESNVMFAGFGGQGIMTIGKMLAQGGLESGAEVSWIPSYGPEMRGGTAYCLVVVSDKPIGSPIITNPMHLVAMNRPSLEKVAPLMRPNGTCIINSSLIPGESGRADVDEVMVPGNEIAIEMGNARMSSIIALGAFCGRSEIIKLEFLIEAVKYTFKEKPKLIDGNVAALVKGAEYAKAYKKGNGQ
jgi:2-oxoglutarate ferredoxin oxidoreductase subunit gamma